MGSVNLEGLVPVRTTRFGGQVDWDDPIQIPNGLALVSQNMQFLAESVKVRWGQRPAMVFPSGVFPNPTGVDVLTVLGSPQAPTVQQQAGGGIVSANSLNPNAIVGNNASAFLAISPNTQVGLVFGDTGKLYLELPAGSGNLIALPNTRIAAAVASILPTGSGMQTAKAYNRIYQAYAEFMNLVTPISSGPVLAFDASTGFESPVGQNPIAAAWKPNTFYQQGDLVTPTENPAIWFRRNASGFSENTEPTWPPANGYFTSGGIPGTYTPNYQTTTDNEWTSWTPGYASFLPPVQFTTLFEESGGTIGAGQDVYVYTSLFNDLGESAWSQPLKFTNTTALSRLLVCMNSSLPNQGPFMPTWLMTLVTHGTVGGFHWPFSTCVRFYVAAVPTSNPAPTAFYLATTATADTATTISSIPSSGPTFPVRIQPTAAISGQQFTGEGGQRYAILLRQNTMGDLSPVDPRAAIGVSFLGAQSSLGTATITASGTVISVGVDDITQYVPGMTVNLSIPGASVAGSYVVNDVFVGLNIESTGEVQQAAPAGILQFITTGLTDTTSPVNATVSVPAGPCPVAVVPPGSLEGPGYSYDIVAFTVVGIGASGPFFYLASATPPNPFSTEILFQESDGLGDGYAQLASVDGLSAGNNVLIAGWTGGLTALNGLRNLASVNAAVNSALFPDTATALQGDGGSSITMSLIQSQPTQAVAQTPGILLQFDDTTLPQGVDVTGNLLFVALPPCTDLAYIPSVTRMAYVSDLFPTTLIFSEEDFMGEVDGLNDILTIEASNGATLVGARELLNGTIVAAKQNAGYQITPTADVPARWGLGTLWGNHGPWSGKNIAKGRDGARLPFFMFVDPESGLYKWPPTLGLGEELDNLSKELSGANNQDASRMATWDRVNRAAGATIEVVVDTIAKEVKIAVPLDGATSPSHILTMSYFNGWQDPLLLTLSGEWVPSRQARRWNIDPIPTNCMALVKRTLATPVDQRVNYQQLLLGTPIFLPASYANIVATSLTQSGAPTIPPGAYYAQLARVTGGQETAYTPVLGPFTVSVSGSGPYALNTFQAVLPADGLEDSWTIYWGTSPSALTKKITGISKSVSTYNVTTAGVTAGSATGRSSLTYMQPAAYDDLGGGYLARYRPAYAREAPNQKFMNGERYLRFTAVTGKALGAGNMLITAVTDDPNYEPPPKNVGLGIGAAEVPGSAPITHFAESLMGDSYFLSCEYSNGGVPGAWFQLMQHTVWHTPLRPTK